MPIALDILVMGMHSLNAFTTVIFSSPVDFFKRVYGKGLIHNMTLEIVDLLLVLIASR